MKKILIIEDDKTICDLLKDDLLKFGKIFIAYNTKDAFHLISENTIDLIITDYFLTETNGLDLIKSVYLSFGHIPTILISANPTVEMLTEGIELKVITFIKKPINLDFLISKVESILLFDTHYEIGDAKITMRNSDFSLLMDQEKIQLTEIQFKMMKYFLDNKDRTINREKMTSHIWGNKRTSSENILDTHLLNLKKKVPLLKNHLKTLPRVGYLFSLKN
jgi:DNA-binding response OmpR family regulator